MVAGYILVGVMTAAAVSWLVWVELHSRRNEAKQVTEESAGEGVCDTSCLKEVRTEEHERPMPRRRKASGLKRRSIQYEH
jgi:hypothetical protein